jgi:hypothetical protein
MKQLIIIASLVLSAAAHAERVSTQPIICYPSGKVVDGLTSEGEEPILIATNPDKDNVVIWVNPKTKSFSITKTSPSKNETCVIEIGEKIRPFQLKQQPQRGAVI